MEGGHEGRTRYDQGSGWLVAVARAIWEEGAGASLFSVPAFYVRLQICVGAPDAVGGEQR